jgi:hypothetical protein
VVACREGKEEEKGRGDHASTKQRNEGELKLLDTKSGA